MGEALIWIGLINLNTEILKNVPSTSTALKVIKTGAKVGPVTALVTAWDVRNDFNTFGSSGWKAAALTVGAAAVTAVVTIGIASSLLAWGVIAVGTFLGVGLGIGVSALKNKWFGR